VFSAPKSANKSTEKKEVARASENKIAKLPAKKEEDSIQKLSKKVYEAPGFTATGFTGKVLSGADEPVQRKTKKKGYVSLKTNLGDINIQLHTDIVPKTTENFLKLCKSGYYDNCTFHRSIPKFMVSICVFVNNVHQSSLFSYSRFKEEILQEQVEEGGHVGANLSEMSSNHNCNTMKEAW